MSVLAPDPACVAFAAQAALAGAAISMLGQPVHSSDPLTASLEEWQFVLGEGPALDAFSRCEPVAIPDTTDETLDWIQFGEFVVAAGIGAIFSFPLTVSAECFGALTVYSHEPGPLTTDQHERSVAFASFVTLTAAVGAEDARHDRSDDFNRATGIVMGQLGIGVDDARSRIRACAFAGSVALDAVVTDILEHRILMDDDAAG